MKPPMWKYVDAGNPGELADTLQRWRCDMPGLGVLALVSEYTQDMVPTLQQLANQQALPLAGAVVPGLIAGGELKKSGVLLVAHDAATPQTMVPLQFSAEGVENGAVADLAAFIEEHASEQGGDTLLLFIDAMTPGIGALLDDLYLEIGNRVLYAGTSVGSESFKPERCLFDNTSFVANALLAMLLPENPGASLAHRYCKAMPLGIATGASANRIAFIDGRPAFDVYRELIAETHGVELTQDNFYQYAVHFPLALHLAEGEPLVRIAVSVDDLGRLYCVGDVPESSLLVLVEAANPESFDTAREIAASLRVNAPAAALTFYCAGRLLHHGGEAAAKELSELQSALEPAPVFGALSLGEIANYHGQGYPRFHNATIVALPWH